VFRERQAQQVRAEVSNAIFSVPPEAARTLNRALYDALHASAQTLNADAYAAANFAYGMASLAWAAEAQVTSGIAREARLGYEFVFSERTNQAHLVRDIFGDPFRTLALDPAWLAWHHGAATRFAADIYDSHAFDRLPLLADALEDAGCTDPDLLGHLRCPGPHVRGCWAVDLILNKT
jgi:hypothetical protein